MGNVEPTNTYDPIQHSDEYLVIYMIIIIQEIQSVQSRVVSRVGSDRLSFYIALLLIL